MKSKKIKQIIREELQQRIGQGTLKENGDTGRISLMGGNACHDAQGNVVPCPQGVDGAGEEQARINRHSERPRGEIRTTSEIGHEGYEDSAIAKLGTFFGLEESQAQFNHMITEELGRLLSEVSLADLVVPDDYTSTNWLDLGSEIFNDAVSPYRDISDYVLPTTRMMPNYGQSPQTIIVPDKPPGVLIPQSVESPTPEATIQPRHRTPPPPPGGGRGGRGGRGPGQGDPTAGGYQGGPAGPPGRRDLYETRFNQMIKEELGSLLNEFNVFTDLFGGNEKQGVPQPDTRADRITRTTGQPVMGQEASTHLANHYQQLKNAARAAAREKQNESRTPDLDESIQENWLYDTMDNLGLVYHGSEEQGVPQPQTASEKRAEKQAAQGVDSGNRDDMPSWVHDPAPAGGSKKVDVSINESKDPFSRMKELALKPYGSILKD